MVENLYKTLDINETATKSDIKKAYRTKAKINQFDSDGKEPRCSPLSYAERITMNISKKIQTIFAVNKKTGDKKSVNLLSIGERRFNCPDDDWGIWHNYSKRGDWEIYIETQPVNAANAKSHRRSAKC